MPDRHDITIAAASAAVPAPTAPDIIGYQTQCDCGATAITRARHRNWVCPECEDAQDRPLLAEPDESLSITVKRWLPGDPVETGHDIGLTHAAETFPQHQRPRRCLQGHDGVIRYGICDACGQAAKYPWGDSIPWPPQADDDDYPIGGVTA